MLIQTSSCSTYFNFSPTVGFDFSFPLKLPVPSTEKLQLSYLPMDPAPTSNKIFLMLAFSFGIYVVSFLMVFFLELKF